MNNDILYPDYNHCILNTISSILHYYGVSTKYNGNTKLDEILTQHQYKNIVLLILDGMGNTLLNSISPNGFFAKNTLDVITTVYPSTTTAAMNTYYSGKPPIETGWIAMSQYFKEYGRAIEMLRQKDSYTNESYNHIDKDLYDLIKYKTIYEQIEQANSNIKAYEILPSFCKAHSIRSINADNIDTMCDSIKSLCTNTDSNFILAYNDNPDTYLHKYGCNSPIVKDFLLETERQIGHLYNSLFTSATDTLLIISADHGHKDITTIYDITNIPELQECFILPPSLESRSVTFWIKDSKKVQFETYFKQHFKNEFLLLTKEDFLSQHYLGYGTTHPKIDDFLGNYVAISIDSSILKLGTKLSVDKPKKKSTHCGLTRDEMEVPLIVIQS